MRTCTKCGLRLPLGEFGKSKNGPDGLNYWCKACVRLNAQRHRARLVETFGREGHLAMRRQAYIENRETIQQKRKQRQELLREHFTKQALKWQSENRDKVKEIKKRHTEKNKPAILAYSRNYHATHKPQRNAHQKKRKAIDPAFKLRERLRSTFADKLRKAIQDSSGHAPTGRKHSVMRLIACSLVELLAHLESQFQPGMSWENWGRGSHCWHIDHIRPIASFNLFDAVDLAKCWHHTNLRPLWSIENLKKGARFTEKQENEKKS